MRLFNLFNKNNSNAAAGLFIHNGLFRYIAFERKENAFSVISALADRVKGGSFAAQTDMVFSMLKKFADTNIKISLALPASDSMIKTLALPMDINDARKAMRYELEKFFPVNKNEAMFDLAELEFPFAEQYDGRHYLVAVTHRSQVRTIRDTAAHYGFEIECVEPAQLALERAASLYSYQRATLLVYIGSRYFQQILFWHGNGIAYRSTDFTNYEYQECYSDESELKQQRIDNFVREMQAFLTDSYNTAKIMPKSIAIFGPSATREVALSLEESFDTLNVDCLDIMELNSIEMEDAKHVSFGYWDVPIGLALRHFDGC